MSVEEEQFGLEGAEAKSFKSGQMKRASLHFQ